MTLDEWRRIGGPLFAAFPRQGMTVEQQAETLTVYYADLAEFEAVDVDNACTWLRQNTGPFVPSVAIIREHVVIERNARVQRERLPDFTGVAQLPPAEQERLHDAGLRASVGAPPPLTDAQEAAARKYLESAAQQIGGSDD